FVRERLSPAAAADADQLTRLIADLDSPRFTARAKAVADLERLGELAEPDLRRALARQPSAEARAQIERLLGKLNEPTSAPDTLRAIRVVELLEMLGTPEAGRVLAALANG